MKLPAATALALSIPLLAPADWVMENQMENPRAKITATIKAKGDKFRVDSAGGPRGATSAILDTATDEITLLIHEKKEARKVSGAVLKQRLETLKKSAPETLEAPKATGKKEKIGDWECEIYAWENGQTSARYWVATNVPKVAEVKAMMAKLNAGGLGGTQSGPDTAALPGVVVKTETTTSSAGKSTLTIGSIKEQTIDATEFSVPADYEVKAPPVNLRAVPSEPSGAPGIEKRFK